MCMPSGSTGTDQSHMLTSFRFVVFDNLTRRIYTSASSMGIADVQCRYSLNMKETGDIRHSYLRIPKSVNLEHGNLIWRYGKMPPSEFHRPTDNTLLKFSELATATGDAIREFARRRGVLEAAQIKPKYKQPTDIKLSDGTVWRLGVGDRIEGTEPLGLWQGLAREVRAILRINAALKGRTHNPSPTIGSPEDWEVLGEGEPLEDVRDAQFFLQIVVNRWLMMGKVRMELQTTGFLADRTAWNLEIAYDALAGGLAYRLLLTVVGESRLYACTGCGRPYIRFARAPQPGQENFCDDEECAKISRKRATERYLAEKRKQSAAKKRQNRRG